jgi:hypothetical protein
MAAKQSVLFELILSGKFVFYQRWILPDRHDTFESGKIIAYADPASIHKAGKNIFV